MSVQPLYPTPHGRSGSAQSHRHGTADPHARWVDHVPTALQAEYYAQRASAGLIVPEATAISADGFGFADTSGLWSADQVRAWRLVTDAVHAAGGRIIGTPALLPILTCAAVRSHCRHPMSTFSTSQ
jgi:hypothetical protein